MEVTENSDSEKLKLKPKQKHDLINHILKCWEEADAARSQWMRDKQEGLQLYWGIRRNKDFPFKNCANLHVPLVRTIADTLHSNVLGSLNFERPIAIEPVGPEDVPNARDVEKTLNWQITTQVDYFTFADRAINAALVLGAAPVKVRYRIEKDGERKIYDGIKIDVIPPERFLTPPDAESSDVQAMEYVMQEVPLSKSDIMKRIASDMYEKIDKDKLERYAAQDSKADNLLENIRELYSGIAAQSAAIPKNHCTVIEWYGNYDLDEDGIDEKIQAIVLKESRELLRSVRWDDSVCFVIINASEIPGRALGESVPDMLARINEELNTIHNQRVDAVTVTNIPFFFFDPLAGFNPNEVKLTPGLGIPVNGSPTQAVYFPQTQAIRPEMYREEDNLFTYGERLLGAGSNVQGILDPKRLTATEVASIDRRAGIRFLTLFNRIRAGLKQVFNLVLELDKKYMPREVQVRIVGLDSSEPIFEKISRQSLSGQFDLIVNGNSVIDEQAERQQMLQLYSIGMANPIVVRDETAVYELTRDLFEKLGAKRINSYLRKPVDSLPKLPEEEHNLFLQEEYVEPNLAEDVEDHIKKHAALINSENFKILGKNGQMIAMKHFNRTVQMRDAMVRLQKIQELQRINGLLLQSQITGAVPPEAIGLTATQQQPPAPNESAPPTRRGRRPRPQAVGGAIG